MRTYTRKPPDHQEIEGVEQLCRLCLGRSQDTVPIFENSENVCAILALRIRMCVGLEITREDTLPNKICTECYQELDRCYSFRKRCEVTYQKLKSHVLAVKGKQHRAQLNCQQNNNTNDVKDDGDNDKLKFFVKFDQDQAPEILTVNEVTDNNISVQIPDERRENNIETEEVNEELEDDTDVTGLDISTFLTTMLLQIGLLTQQDDGLTLTDESLKTIELETGDGNIITMQLMEEDEQIEQVLESPQVNESPPTEADTEPDAQKQSDIVIKYITSKYGASRENSKDILPGGSFPEQSGKNTKEDNKKTKQGQRGDTWCDICGKRLATRSALSRHWRVHSGEKPYSCRDCGRAFSQREVMLRHRLVHTGERPFKCATCDKGFTQRGALLAHERAHVPPHERALALHRCARCPKVFLHASGLSRHMMVHNGRVYVCGACGRQFRDKSSLLRHMRNTNHAQDNVDSWAPTDLPHVPGTDEP